MRTHNRSGIVASTVKRFLIPGSTTFFTVGFGFGVVLLHIGPPAWGRAWLTALLGLYWLLSLPVVSHLLIQGLLPQYGSLRTPAEAAGAKLLVAIGNGSVHYAAGDFTADQLTRRSAFCVFEAARLYRLIEPEWLIASGGVAGSSPRAIPESELMREQLVKFQVPADRILLESTSRTTAEQVANVLRLLEERGLGRTIVVVTTTAHMNRVLKLFRDGGIHAVPSVTPDLRYDDGRTGWRRWYPSASALRGSESAMYEYLARIHAAVA